MIKTRTFVNIPVVLVWQQKTVNIAALIVKLSRPGQRSLAGVGIRSVPAKLTEVETQIACFNVSHFSKRTGEIMSTETILIILLVVFLLGGGGWYYSRG
jgi:hypothetical protein